MLLLTSKTSWVFWASLGALPCTTQQHTEPGKGEERTEGREMNLLPPICTIPYRDAQNSCGPSPALQKRRLKGKEGGILQCPVACRGTVNSSTGGREQGLLRGGMEVKSMGAWVMQKKLKCSCWLAVISHRGRSWGHGGVGGSLFSPCRLRKLPTGSAALSALYYVASADLLSAVAFFSGGTVAMQSAIYMNAKQNDTKMKWCCCNKTY